MRVNSGPLWPRAQTTRGRTRPDEGALSSWLTLVYQHRELMALCQSKRGLTIDQIDELTAIEALFAPNPRRPNEQRQHFRPVVRIRAVLRTATESHIVQILDVSPGGVGCHGPQLSAGTRAELVIDDPATGSSFRFKTRVAWTRNQSGEDPRAGLAFIGVPIRLDNISRE
jgi:hypothetical protein